jgi:hypothetical protein
MNIAFLDIKTSGRLNGAAVLRGDSHSSVKRRINRRNRA